MDTNKTAHEHTDKDTLPASCPAFNDRHAIEVLPCWYDHLSFVSGRMRKRLGQRKRSSEAAKQRSREAASQAAMYLRCSSVPGCSAFTGPRLGQEASRGGSKADLAPQSLAPSRRSRTLPRSTRPLGAPGRSAGARCLQPGAVAHSML